MEFLKKVKAAKAAAIVIVSAAIAFLFEVLKVINLIPDF
jgi:hypothetical protein